MDTVPEKNKVIFKTAELETARLVIPVGKVLKKHQVSGPITTQCLKGNITLTAMGRSQELTSGQFLYLLADEAHSLTATIDSIVLLTIIFKH